MQHRAEPWGMLTFEGQKVGGGDSNKDGLVREEKNPEYNSQEANKGQGFKRKGAEQFKPSREEIGCLEVWQESAVFGDCEGVLPPREWSSSREASVQGFQKEWGMRKEGRKATNSEQK